MTSSAIFNTILITILAVLAVRGLTISGDKDRAPHCLPGRLILQATPSSETERAYQGISLPKTGYLQATPQEVFQL